MPSVGPSTISPATTTTTAAAAMLNAKMMPAAPPTSASPAPSAPARQNGSTAPTNQPTSTANPMPPTSTNNSITRGNASPLIAPSAPPPSSTTASPTPLPVVMQTVDVAKEHQAIVDKFVATSTPAPTTATPGTQPLEASGRFDAAKHHAIVEKLLAAKTSKAQKQVLIREEDIRMILNDVREVFMSQSMLLEIVPPIKVCGDIHGQFYDLMRIFDKCGFPPQSNYLFLGDYVDRGKHSVETIVLLFCYKCLYPETFFLLRGNHECLAINKMYGFFDDIKRRYTLKLFKHFTDVFNTMPVACCISDKILCMHGGLSQEIDHLDSIRRLTRPIDVPDRGLLCDLLWADPDAEISGWERSERGVSWVFGEDVVGDFLDALDLDLIVRAHEVQEKGYGFFASRQLVTLFSAPNYCGEFDNDAAVMNIDEKLQCSFLIVYARAN